MGLFDLFGGSNQQAGQTPAPQQGGGFQFPMGLFNSFGGGGGGGLFGGGAGGGAGGSASMSSLGSPALFAALIGLGKNMENAHPNTAFGQGLLAGLGPSASQIIKDPMGMGLPTLMGASFLTPFTSSKAAQQTKPEWQSLFSLGS